MLYLTSQPIYRQDAFWIVAVMLIIMCFLLLTYIYVRRRFAREIAYRKRLVHSYEKELDRQKAETMRKEDELRRQRLNLEHTKEELERVTREIEAYKIELRAKELSLEEKIRQNKAFIKLLHQTELEGSATDIVNAVRQSSMGRHDMSDADWKMLLRAVDELYPTFNDTLARRMGTADRQEMRVCYLIRIGLTNPQIQNITGLPRTTVWRWVKKYEWIQQIGQKP